MGFDPNRKYQRTRFDYLYVASGLIVAMALVAWAAFG